MLTTLTRTIGRLWQLFCEDRLANERKIFLESRMQAIQSDEDFAKAILPLGTKVEKLIVLEIRRVLADECGVIPEKLFDTNMLTQISKLLGPSSAVYGMARNYDHVHINAILNNRLGESVNTNFFLVGALSCFGSDNHEVYVVESLREWLFSIVKEIDIDS